MEKIETQLQLDRIIKEIEAIIAEHGYDYDDREGREAGCGWGRDPVMQKLRKIIKDYLNAPT